ncbi:MAG: alanine--glyoxylate aminotransferase family protein [Phycisphaerae bacterium]|nr:alanine--glyoxylate aminotransferase family protein [Phycisphaerae bacterium]MCZ2399395.1 alanine--glyoxylate aminotransferase family protein [Phycisphaerae bacterium]NUQ48871.1 alanine--glyoxylate aminotransferase family protein [Phycisphaerae bacterium]
MKRIRLFTPGPCAVPEEVLLEMARPFHHHRTDWFKGMLKDATAKLQQVLMTKYDVLTITGSGTAAAEGAIVGLHPPGSKLLNIEGGKFGQRWGEIAQQFGIEVVRHEIEWGTAIDPSWIADALKKDPAITSVMVVHSETSTATRCDLEAIGKVCKQAGKFLLADCITSAGALPLRPDDWGVDVVITGSQKSLMLPPGLGFVALSPKAVAAIESNKSQHAYYLNLNKARKSALEFDTPFTPAHLLVRGLAKALDLLLEEGIEKVWKRVAAMAAATRAAGEAIGLPVFSKSPSDSVTALTPPAGITVKDIRNALEQRFGIESAGGQDRLKGKILRIGHMGAIDEMDTVLAVAALEQALYKLGHKLQLGAGVTAAQKVLAERL